MALFYMATQVTGDRERRRGRPIYGNWSLLKWQFLAGLFVIGCTGFVTFVLLKLVGVFIPLRMSQQNMEIGDTAEHGHEVYPSDVPSLGYPNGVPASPG